MIMSALSVWTAEETVSLQSGNAGIKSYRLKGLQARKQQSPGKDRGSMYTDQPKRAVAMGSGEKAAITRLY